MEGTAAVNVTRQELYDRVWAEPVSRACKTYGLSDVGLAKICAAWAIPRPPRGYWAKLQSGQRVRAAKLKPIPEGDPVVLTYRPQPDPPPPDPDQPPTAADLQRAFETRPENRIVVPDELTDPHPLAERTAASLRAALVISTESRSTSAPNPGPLVPQSPYRRYVPAGGGSDAYRGRLRCHSPAAP